NYASSFISAIYPGRRVPDVCGLVGQLPNAAYIMLPVPKGSAMDRRRSLIGDETKPNDSWAAFSGTSSAAPQLAGACALLEQYVPGLPPLKTKQILRETAHDIREGQSNPKSGATQARAGPDLATGYGLAVVSKAIKASQVIQRQNVSSFSKLKYQMSKQKNTSSKLRRAIQTTPQRRILSMSLDESTLRKLRKRIDEIQIELNKTLKDILQRLEIEDDIELIINEENFIGKQQGTDFISSFLETLKEVANDKGEINDGRKDDLRERHIFAAESLLKQRKCQEIATVFLVSM
ncbi:MAG: S8 family serine peptidase, partial [Symploca sp. SIO3C6]|nr:S8 family serine peptidase [Symploca sp. SIO3C6]